MSHITKIKLEILDIAALERAAETLGLEFVKDAKTFTYYAGNKGSCDHMIKVKNDKYAYQVGVVKIGEAYELRTDFHQGGKGLIEKIGRNGKRLSQEYTIEVALARFKREGRRVSRVDNQDGSVKLVAGSRR